MAGATKVCGACFGDTFLKRVIRKKGQTGQCDYCGKARRALDMNELPDLDGMIYPSVQVADGMKNVVLFHKAAVVALVNRPKNVNFITSDREYYEEGEQIEYRVREEFDSEAITPPIDPDSRDQMRGIDAEPDPREPALELSKD